MPIPKQAYNLTEPKPTVRQRAEVAVREVTKRYGLGTAFWVMQLVALAVVSLIVFPEAAFYVLAAFLSGSATTVVAVRL